MPLRCNRNVFWNALYAAPSVNSLIKFFAHPYRCSVFSLWKLLTVLAFETVVWNNVINHQAALICIIHQNNVYLFQ